MAFGFLKKAVKAAGKIVSAPVHVVAKIPVVGKVAMAPVNLTASATGAITGQLRKIPVVGKGLGAAVSLGAGPILVASAVAKGATIDQAVLTRLKEDVKNVKDVAPYAQMVVTMVPGIGTGVSAGISAGLALASGQPITAAIVAGVKGALPGGPLAQSAFNMGESLMSGKPIDATLIAGVPGLDATQKQMLITGLKAAKDLAAGKNVNKTLIATAENLLPPDVKKALTIGIAIGEAQTLQRKAQGSLNPDTLVPQGQAACKVNPVFSAGFSLIKDPGEKRGYLIGVGLMQNKVTPLAVTTIRKQLKGLEAKGFDTALAAQIGLTEKPVPKNMPAREVFGYATARGTVSMPAKNRKSVMRSLGTDNSTRAGATVAIKDVAKERNWFIKMLNYIGIATVTKLPPKQLPPAQPTKA